MPPAGPQVSPTHEAFTASLLDYPISIAGAFHGAMGYHTFTRLTSRGQPIYAYGCVEEKEVTTRHEGSRSGGPYVTVTEGRTRGPFHITHDHSASDFSVGTDLTSPGSDTEHYVGREQAVLSITSHQRLLLSSKINRHLIYSIYRTSLRQESPRSLRFSLP